jgi:lipopolysaccharide export LptBFGC system permease protein LptF
MKDAYRNPLFRLPMTFAEIFPMGLLIALISAAILRNPKILPARA